MGLPAVRKQRRLRSWRHPDLDDRLGRRRMIAEARLMVRLPKWPEHPSPLRLDIKEQQLVMSNIPGSPLIELLNDESIDNQRFENTFLLLVEVFACFIVKRSYMEISDQQHHDYT